MKVQGFHGTSLTAAREIERRGFNASSNTYDWLGRGIYFWQDAPMRAREWAEQHHSEPVVVAAEIDLDGCMDLLDIGWQRVIAERYTEFFDMVRRSGHQVPAQRAGAHRLDAGVMNFLVEVWYDEGVAIRSIRAAFAEGVPVFPGSAILTRSHVQIAVREAAMITIVEMRR